MASQRNPDLTGLIRRWTNGEKEIEQELFEVLYDALHDLALKCVRREAPERSLGATALVHEAYIRFRRTQNLTINNRDHFFALASRVMRRILVDRARARQARPRLEPAIAAYENAIMPTDVEAEEIIAVDRALGDLSGRSPRQAQLVELRYFGGYSLEECAALLQISEKTAQRDWRVARVRLRISIDGTT